MRIRELKKLMAQLSTGGSSWKVATALADVDHGVPPVFDLADPSTWGPKISPEITVTATEMMIVEIAAGLEMVQRSMQERTVRAGEEELFKHRAREKGRIKIIDLLRARLDSRRRHRRSWMTSAARP